MTKQRFFKGCLMESFLKENSSFKKFLNLKKYLFGKINSWTKVVLLGVLSNRNPHCMVPEPSIKSWPSQELTKVTNQDLLRVPHRTFSSMKPFCCRVLHRTFDEFTSLRPLKGSALNRFWLEILGCRVPQRTFYKEGQNPEDLRRLLFLLQGFYMDALRVFPIGKLLFT